MKKWLVITIIILAVSAVLAGIYFAWKNSQKLSSLIPSFNNENQGIQTPQILSNSKLKIISQNEATSYWVSNQNTSSSIFYADHGGRIFKISNGKEEILDNIAVNDLISINTSSNGEFLAIKSGKINNAITEILNFNKNIWYPPMIGVVSLDFSPDGKKAAYLEMNSAKSVDLIIKNLDDSKQKTQKITTINVKDFNLKWVENDRLLLVPKPSFDTESDMWEFNLKAKTFSKLLSNRGLMASWSKFGDIGLKFSANENHSYNFGLIDNKGQTKANFQFKTFPDKCFISSPSQIYCAISRNQDVFFGTAIFPDDYLKRSILFKDGIYQIDLTSNKLQALYEEEEPVIDAVNLSILGNKLLFMNRYDGKLYSLDL
ncbi:MAG: hypothetical protein QMD86_01605 [Patescibacteria group bacterium]|nr:hypothetical protein [Patescibacteria group bacterium]